ncbi:MAG TPA: serine/threonine-protein kinase [Polyangiaceae bacterium]|nr:serine/threonine-protein kinase [Polyangiaceae bacterium]
MTSGTPETFDALALEPVCDLGRGGMGTVRLVRLQGPEQFGRLFVLKRLREDRMDAEAALRFAYEGQLASVIRHANVVQTHHVGQDERGLFLVLDYVEGASLEQLLAALASRGGRVPQPIALRVVLDVLAGLSAVHEAKDHGGRVLGVIHRDVTLQNILIGVDGVSRLADFGIAKTNFSPVRTNQAYVMGKLRFLAPEYVRREEVTQSIDVYSLGVSLWHALTGRVLWRDANEAELIEHVMLDRVPPVSTHVAVPPELEALVSKACARAPGDRFKSAGEMYAAIEGAGLPIATHGDVGELVLELFADHLAQRRKQVAEVTARSRPYQPKVYSANVRLVTTPKRGGGSARTRRRRRGTLFVGAAVLSTIGAALAFFEGRADGVVEGRSAPAVAVAAPATLPASASAPALPAPASETNAAAPPPAQTVANVQPGPATAAPRRPGSPSRLIKKNPYRD